MSRSDAHFRRGILRRFVGHCVFTCSALILTNTYSQSQGTPRGLDVETLSPEAASVYRVWQRYLASKNGEWSVNAGAPSIDWLQSEQKRWPMYDLASFYIPHGAIPEIVSVERTEACGRSEYRILTRFRSGNRGPGVSSLAAVNVTVYAVRDADRWVLANALPFRTCAWRRAAVGQITYIFAPGYPYDAARARRAVAFSDSVASAFSLPRLDSLTYYLTTSIDEMYEIIGLESDIKYGSGPVGGLAQPVNHQLFSGNPRIGEEYRHELAHLILAPICCGGTSYLVSEGVPTWLGGTAGMDFATAARGLGAFLADNPAVSLDSILSGSYDNAIVYPAGAVLADLVFERGGVTAVKGLFNAGGTPTDLRSSLERQLGRPWRAILLDWRQRAMALATRYVR